jgi:integrase
MKKQSKYNGMPHTISSHNSVARSRSGTRIFRRTEKGSWTYKSQFGGVQNYWPLGTEKKKALELADQIRAHLILNPYQEVLEMYNKKKFATSKDPTPTISQVVQILKDNRISSGVGERCLKNYADGLKRFARVVTGEKEVDGFDLGKLNDNMFRDFKLKSLRGITDQALIASKKRTLNSIIRGMKAVFTRLSIFEGYNLEFVDCVKRQEFFRGLKKQYRLPALDLIQKTFDLWPKTDGDTHTLIGLALYFGLRRNEIYHARADWFDLGSGDSRARVNIVSENSFKPKGGHEGFTMGSSSIAKAIINKALGDDYLIGNRVDKGNTAFKKCLDQLREIGWERANPLHELRKLFGSYIASTEGIYISQKFLRHADASTTNDSYADAIVDEDIKSLWTLQVA